MDNFDQFIKDNIENHHHDFKPRYWKSFSKKAGLKTGVSALKAALISGAAILVVGTIAVIVWPDKEAPQTMHPAPPQETAGIVYEDTTGLFTETVREDTITVEEIIANRNSTLKSGTVSRSAVRSNIPAEVKDEPIYPVGENPEKKQHPTRMGRILTIDPDTIKTNF